MKLLAIDYGEKRIGLAITDGYWIAPQKPLENLSLDEIIITLEKIVKREKIEKIILGLPYPFKIKQNDRLKITKTFGKELEQAISVPLEFSSEIFTTKLAKMFSYTKSQKKNIDSRAACFILEHYLTKINAKKY